MKKINKILIFAIILLGCFVYTFYNYFYIEIKKVGEMPYPKTCISLLTMDNQLIIAGGYNQSQTYSDIDIFDLTQQKFTKKLKSNFNNKYGNFLYKINDNIFANIQLLKLNDGSKSGIEIFKPNYLNGLLYDKKLSSKISGSDFMYYSTNTNNFYFASMLNDKNTNIYYYDFNANKIIKIPNSYEGYAGISQGLIFVGDSVYSLEQSKKIAIIKPLQSFPEIFKLSFSFNNDNDEFLIIDKKNATTEIQAFWVNPNQELNYSVKIKTPAILKKYQIYQAFQLDENNIIFLFTKSNKFIIARYKSGDKQLRIVKYFSDKCKNMSFVLIPDKNIKNVKLIAVGGILTNDNFKCGDNFPSNSKPCKEIKEYTFKLY